MKFFLKDDIVGLMKFSSIIGFRFPMGGDISGSICAYSKHSHSPIPGNPFKPFADITEMAESKGSISTFHSGLKNTCDTTPDRTGHLPRMTAWPHPQSHPTLPQMVPTARMKEGVHLASPHPPPPLPLMVPTARMTEGVHLAPPPAPPYL